MRVKGQGRARNVGQGALRASAREVVFRQTKKGQRVVRGPVRKVKPGTVKVREWGRDVEVEVKRVGQTFLIGGVEVRYGYLDEETPGQDTLD